MKPIRSLLTPVQFLALLALLVCQALAQIQTGLPVETPAQREARMRWWREARFGMFVHWGLYSGLAGTWEGKAVGTRGGMEWIQNQVKADTGTYAKAALPLFCMTMNTTWGYSAHDHAWKSDQELIRNLVDIASKGGNYLLNIGPQGDGSVPEPSSKSLHAIGAWMRRNGDAIHGTTANAVGPVTWGRITAKPGRLYLHVFDWPADGKLVVPATVTKGKAGARFLAENDRARLEVRALDSAIEIREPPQAPDPIATVIRLDGAFAAGLPR